MDPATRESRAERSADQINLPARKDRFRLMSLNLGAGGILNALEGLGEITARYEPEILLLQEIHATAEGIKYLTKCVGG